MYVSATPRYEASSLSPLAKRTGRDRGQRQEHAAQHDASDGLDDAPQHPAEPDEPADVAFDLPDETLGYSTALPSMPVAEALPGSPVPPVASPAPPDDSLFALLDRVVAKP